MNRAACFFVVYCEQSTEQQWYEVFTYVPKDYWIESLEKVGYKITPDSNEETLSPLVDIQTSSVPQRYKNCRESWPTLLQELEDERQIRYAA